MLDLVFVSQGDDAQERARAHRLLSTGLELDRLVLLAPDESLARQLADASGATAPWLMLAGVESVEGINRALLSTEGDVLLVGTGVSLDAAAVRGLQAALRSGDRIGIAVASTLEGEDSSGIAQAVEGLPIAAPIPAPDVICVLLSRAMLDAAGALDPRFPGPLEALADLSMRALRLGFTTVRALHALVNVADHLTVRFPESGLVQRRHISYAWLCQRAVGDVSSRLPTLALGRVRGRMSVCLDLRYLPEDAVNGTNVYAIELARALKRHTPARLSLLVMSEAQRGKLAALELPTYLDSQTVPQVQLVHRPAQVFRATDLKRLLRTPSAFVITFQDLIAWRAASVFANPSDYETYRLLSHLAVRSAQAVVAISEHNQKELVRELAVPESAVQVVHHGVDAAWFAARVPARHRSLLAAPDIPGPFYFFVGSDYAHKNLRNLLAAYAQVRARWSGTGPVPSLALAGHPSGTTDGAYPHLRSRPPPGVLYLGSVTNDEMRALYQEALALTFPSVYEGFGLPILESMAAGTPVICARFSSIPEVAGEAAWYVGASDSSLADAMLGVTQRPDERERLVALGRERAARFTWEEAARKTFAVYEQALLRPSAASLYERQTANIMAERLF